MPNQRPYDYSRILVYHWTMTLFLTLAGVWGCPVFGIFLHGNNLLSLGIPLLAIWCWLCGLMLQTQRRFWVLGAEIAHLVIALLAVLFFLILMGSSLYAIIDAQMHPERYKYRFTGLDVLVAMIMFIPAAVSLLPAYLSLWAKRGFAAMRRRQVEWNDRSRFD